MHQPKNDLCPFGSEYQGFWEMRYDMLTQFDECRVDARGLYSIVPEKLALIIASRVFGVAERIQFVTPASGTEWTTDG